MKKSRFVVCPFVRLFIQLNEREKVAFIHVYIHFRHESTRLELFQTFQVRFDQLKCKLSDCFAKVNLNETFKTPSMIRVSNDATYSLVE